MGFFVLQSELQIQEQDSTDKILSLESFLFTGSFPIYTLFRWNEQGLQFKPQQRAYLFSLLPGISSAWDTNKRFERGSCKILIEQSSIVNCCSLPELLMEHHQKRRGREAMDKKNIWRLPSGDKCCLKGCHSTGDGTVYVYSPVLVSLAQNVQTVQKVKKSHTCPLYPATNKMFVFIPNT